MNCTKKNCRAEAEYGYSSKYGFHMYCHEHYLKLKKFLQSYFP